MNQYQQSPQVADDEIDLRELFKVIWQGKWIIIATTFVFAAISIVYSLSLPDVYKAETTLAPASEQKALGVGQLAGMAALAGINLGGAAGIDQTVLALEIIKSKKFLANFISRNEILVELMASKSWDLKSRKLEIDEELYDINSNSWVREVKLPLLTIPSDEEAYQAFMNIMEVKQDKLTGIIEISVTHISPDLAQKWLALLIKAVNDEMRERDINEANKSIQYLKNQIETTELADIRKSLYLLIEEQMKTLMMANVRDEYVFNIIDPPMIPQIKSGPSRALICILLTFTGGVVGLIIALARSRFKKS